MNLLACAPGVNISAATEFKDVLAHAFESVTMSDREARSRSDVESAHMFGCPEYPGNARGNLLPLNLDDLLPSRPMATAGYSLSSHFFD